MPIRKPEDIKITWKSEPSEEVILRAQLRLLGWTPGEIARVKEELERAGKEPKQSQAASVHDEPECSREPKERHG